MDFSQYIQDYTTLKRLRGVTPGRRRSEALFSPYFDRKFAIEMTGRKQDLAEREQTAREQQQGESLTWDKERAINTLALQKELAAGSREVGRTELASRMATAEGRWASEAKVTGMRLAADTQQADADRALRAWQQQLMIDQAKRGDRSALIGNVISTAGSIGSLALLKKYGYFDRRM